MRVRRTSQLALTAAVCMGVFAQPVFCAGGQEGGLAFARRIVIPDQGVRDFPCLLGRTCARAPEDGALAVEGAATIGGESKNERPFTAPFSADPGLAIALHEITESKIAVPPPAARPTKIVPIFIDSKPGFDWLDASAGAAAALGTCAAAAALRRRKTPVMDAL